MTEWRDDCEMLEVMRRELYTPVVGDILDAHGRCHQFLPPSIRPMRAEMKVAGRAMPVLQHEVFGRQASPFGLMTQALDDLRPNEVYVATGGSQNCANWGEILTAAAVSRGAVGAVVNGFHRDTRKVLEQDFSVFSCGSYAQDSAPRMQVVAFRCPIEIGCVAVEPGDVVFGDVDGVVIVPGSLVETVIGEALAKARTEKIVRKAIEGGMTATDAFAKYGVL